MRRRLLPLLALLLAAAPAAARPPALLWQAAPPAEPSRSAALVLERDATSVRLLTGRIVPGPAKLKARPADGDGLIFVVRDASGEPLLIGETFDAELEVHGDEPDPATGTLRSLAATLESTAFPLRFPLPSGAHDVAILEQPRRDHPPELDALRQGDDLILLGVVPIPRPAP